MTTYRKGESLEDWAKREAREERSAKIASRVILWGLALFTVWCFYDVYWS